MRTPLQASTSLVAWFAAAAGVISTLHSQPVRAQTPTADDFDPEPDGSVYSLMVQTNGQMLAGGSFLYLGGSQCNNLGRLNSDGTQDASFASEPLGPVNSLAAQTDGKILLGGAFFWVQGQDLGRLNPDGTIDETFNPEADSMVNQVVVQADGKILVGGAFKTLAGQNQSHLARLKADGTLDTGFNPGVDGAVNFLGVQGDGGILVGGAFQTLGGESRFHFGRLYNTGASTQSLSFAVSTLTWLRGGTGPKVWRTSCSASTNGVDWVSRSAGFRIAGGWQFTNVALPSGTSLHAQGFAGGGCGNASSWFVDVYFGAPLLASQPVGQTNDAGTTASFSVTAVNSQPLSSFRWLKQGVPLADGGNVSGSGTDTLTLTNVVGGDAGNYCVVLSNAFGSVTSSVASLAVVDPIITVQPASQAVDAGQSVTLSVTVLGAPPLAYQWWKAQAALPGRTGALLTLTNFQLADTGNYLVVVSNRWGKLTSDTAQLTINLATRDTGFNPGTSNTANNVCGLAVQPDGKILLGGDFSKLDGQPRSFLGRLNANGSLDNAFNPGAGGPVYPAIYSFGLRPDNRILVFGSYQTLGGLVRSNIALLNADGSVNGGFSTGVFGWLPFVYAMAMQADGKTVIGGYIPASGSRPTSNLVRLNSDGSFDASLIVDLDTYFYDPGTWQPTPHRTLGRLNPDGTIEAGFNPPVDGAVQTLVLQTDGKILVGGAFDTLCGQPCGNIGRLNNTEPVTNSLSSTGSTIAWLRGGASPEVWRTTFDVSSDGTNWTSLGAGARVTGGWQLSGINVPNGATIRARGYTVGGYHNASTWFVETVATAGPTPPQIVRDGQFGFGPNGFGFDLQGISGQIVAVDCSSNLVNWLPLRTNTLSSGPWYFSDPAAKTKAREFYRVRLVQ